MACTVCYATKHIQHKSSTVDESAETFRKQITDDLSMIKHCLDQVESSAAEVDTYEKSFVDKFSATSRSIAERCNEIKALVVEHRRHLTEQLNAAKVNALRDIAAKKAENEKDSVELRSFRLFCEGIVDNGSAVEVSRVAEEMQKRATELFKTHEQRNSC